MYSVFFLAWKIHLFVPYDLILTVQDNFLLFPDEIITL